MDFRHGLKCKLTTVMFKPGKYYSFQLDKSTFVINVAVPLVLLTLSLKWKGKGYWFKNHCSVLPLAMIFNAKRKSENFVNVSCTDWEK
jgi:hypothetical protein